MKGGGSYFLPLARAPIVVSFQSSCARCCVLSPSCPVNFVQYFTHLSIFFSPLSSPEPCNSSSRVFLYFSPCFSDFSSAFEPSLHAHVVLRDALEFRSCFPRLVFTLVFRFLRSASFSSSFSFSCRFNISFHRFGISSQKFRRSFINYPLFVPFYVRCRRPFPQAIH